MAVSECLARVWPALPVAHQPGPVYWEARPRTWGGTQGLIEEPLPAALIPPIPPVGPTSSLLEHGPTHSQVPAGPPGPGQDVGRWHITLCRLMGLHQSWSASIGVVRGGALLS